MTPAMFILILFANLATAVPGVPVVKELPEEKVVSGEREVKVAHQLLMVRQALTAKMGSPGKWEPMERTVKST